jgi:hypothetical protein
VHEGHIHKTEPPATKSGYYIEYHDDYDEPEFFPHSGYAVSCGETWVTIKNMKTGEQTCINARLIDSVRVVQLSEEEKNAFEKWYAEEHGVSMEEAQEMSSRAHFQEILHVLGMDENGEWRL